MKNTPRLIAMEELKRKAREKAAATAEAEARAAKLDLSFKRILRNVVKVTMSDKGSQTGHQLWHACGIVGRIHRKDAIGTRDGVVLISSRTAIYSPFIANHAQITYYDPETLQVTLPNMPLVSAPSPFPSPSCCSALS
jgi:hypothetical protein